MLTRSALLELTRQHTIFFSGRSGPQLGRVPRLAHLLVEGQLPLIQQCSAWGVSNAAGAALIMIRNRISMFIPCCFVLC